MITVIDLLGLVDRLREKTGAPAVHLVAHSMGGLICRCLLQKVLPDRGRDAAECIGKLFTYGTPHGGIASTSAVGGWSGSGTPSGSRAPTSSGCGGCTST
ncbi:esterase/lipase family protein [Streptomyces sp. NPDC056628]|uniref:esterase/lipase family protein n=1 Tax=Streptomyces sp. NPDC056628 TaxID=3345882 RepID=UPI0036B3BCE2